MSTTTFTVRCTVEQKRRWHRAAEIQGLKFNAWVKSALSEVATEVFMSNGEPGPELPAPKVPHAYGEKGLGVTKPASSKCDHYPYKGAGSFCYHCHERI